MQRKQWNTDLQTTSSNPADIVAKFLGVPTRTELLNLLTENVLEVTFNKLDGDERIMQCTLIADMLPPATKTDALSQTKVRNLEEKTVVVWDINANGWRSFRYDRLKKVVNVTINNPHKET